MKTLEFKNILVVEDNRDLALELEKHFGERNNVVVCPTLTCAIDSVERERFDVILLDVVLPDGSGLELFNALKTETPVIILSDLSSEKCLLDGFDAGALDYIVKPCPMSVLETRMALRLLPEKQASIKVGGLTLDMAKRTAAFDGRSLSLTSSEFNILTFLMQNAGTFFVASEIYENVWKMPHLNTTTIKAHLHNLRKKMMLLSDECGALILTEFVKGYAFAADGK